MGRKEISLTSNIIDLIFKMSEGNPGAITVLIEILAKKDGILYILGLDDMNIRGWQIWMGYKDYCKCDIVKFIECIQNREDKMILAINNEAIRMGSPLRAVKMGASFNR